MKTATVGEAYAVSGGSPPALETLARSTPAELLPDLAADLARAQAIVLTRLITPTSLSVKSEPEADVLLTVEQAAQRLGLTPAQLLRKRDFPARRKLGPKTIRFSSRSIERYLRTRAA